MTDKRPLRVGIILDGRVVGAWVSRTLRKLQAAPFCSIDLVLLPHEAAKGALEVGGRVKEVGPWGHLLLNQLVRRDQKKFRGADPFAEADIAEVLKGLPNPQVVRSPEKAGDSFAGLVRTAIIEADLDLIINLSATDPSASRLGAIETPVWVLCCADAERPQGGPPGFWEWISETATTAITLLEWGPDAQGFVPLAKSHSATDLTSLAANQANSFWKSADLITRELERLHRLGAQEYRDTRPFPTTPLPTMATQGEGPGNVALVWLLARRFSKKIRRLLERTRDGRTGRQQWFLLYSLRDKERDQPLTDARMESYNFLSPPPGRHWADPFPIHRDGKDWILYEDVAQAGGYGVIMALQVDAHGPVGDPQMVLEKPYHLSYPFLLEWEGDLFMIPESGDMGFVQALRCVEFPGKWEHHCRLMDGIKLYDATLVEHHGKWWLLGIVVSSDGVSSHDELFLFHSDHPFSDSWTPHPENPIVSDVGKARPGGRVIKEDGNLYRLGQDSRFHYGRALRIFRIDSMTDSEYRETEITDFRPVWADKVDGFHHLCLSETMVVADARTSRTLPHPSPSGPLP